MVEAPAWRRRHSAASLPLVVLAAPSGSQQPDGAFASPPSEPSDGPRSPYALLDVLKTAALLLLSPLLLAGTVLATSPPQRPAKARERSKHRVVGFAIWAVFCGLMWWIMHQACVQLALQGAPPAVEAFFGSLLGNGHVGEVLAAWSTLPVPASPTMQLLLVTAVYCFYRVMYWFEWWHDATFPGTSAPGWVAYMDRPSQIIEEAHFMRMCTGPHAWALVWTALVAFAPFTFLAPKALAALQSWLLRHNIVLVFK